MANPLQIALGEFNPDTLLLPAVCFLLTGLVLCASLRIGDSLKAKRHKKTRIAGSNSPLIE